VTGGPGGFFGGDPASTRLFSAGTRRPTGAKWLITRRLAGKRVLIFSTSGLGKIS
jgi:hypothetical protein